MAQIALHDYLKQINRLLEDEQPTEAITHCRYLLKQCPRHVDTYRLLARALLENREFEDAAELFQRILSADPNDFIAHVGLSDVYREGGKLSEAIWHMERAYEMSPYDPALQEVLRELYLQRDRAVPDELPLTRPALARLYFKGELYEQAADELRSILGQNGSERVDLQILLAETLWRDNQRVDAVDVSLKVLEKLPDSITVNAILAEIWLLTGRTEEAQTYLQHLRALTQVDQKHLDADSVVGHAFQAEGAPALPPTISVEQWRETADRERLDAGTRVGTEQPIEDEAVYDWLRDTSDTGELLQALADDEEEADWFSDRLEDVPVQEESFAKTAEWLESMGVAPESGDEFDFTEDVSGMAAALFESSDPLKVDDSFSWMDSETAVTSESTDGLSDWLNELDGGEIQADASAEDESDWFMQTADEDVGQAAIGAGLSTGDLLSEAAAMDFDWLDDNESLAEPDFTVQFAQDRDVPQDEEADWFTAKQDEEEAEQASESGLLSTNDLLAEAADVDFDWLEDDEPFAKVEPSAQVIDFAGPESGSADDLFASDVPDWLTGKLDKESERVDLEHLSESEELSTDELFAGAMNDMPDWLIHDNWQGQEPTTDELLADALKTNQLFGDFDEDVPDWFEDESYAEEQSGPTDSGLIDRMNRMMGTADLYDDLPEEEQEFAEEFEETDSVPQGFTNLLIGTGDLTDEGMEEEEEAYLPGMPDEGDEPLGKATHASMAGLWGTAELLADLGEELPDWLQADSDEEAEAEQFVLQTADLRGEKLDEVPHWLFREEDEPEESLEPEEPVMPGLDVIGTAELFESLGEEVPDWILGIKDDNEAQDFPVTGISGVIGTDELLSEMDVDLPDWTETGPGSTADWQVGLADAGSHEMMDEVEDESWLNELETAENVVEAAPEPAKSLLDWLSGQAATSWDPQSDEAGEEEAPDWLLEGGEDEREALIMADNEQEYDFSEMPDDSDDMDWLDELAAQDDLPDKGKKKKPGDGGEGISDWLSELTEPATESEAALSVDDDEVPLTLTDTDLPSWLKDLGEATSTPAKSSITGSLDNLPDWLKPPPDLDLGLPGPTEESEVEEAVASMPGLDDDALDWLGDMVGEDEEELLGFASEDISEAKDTSSLWLDALAMDNGMEETSEADDLAFLQEMSEGLASETDMRFDDEDVDLPDWLALTGELNAGLETAVSAPDEDLSDLFAEPVAGDEPGFTDLIAGLEAQQGEDTFDWLGELADGDDDVLSGLSDEEEYDLVGGPVETAEFMAMFGDIDDEDMLLETADEEDDFREGLIGTAEFMAMFGDTDDEDVLLETADTETPSAAVFDLFADQESDLLAFDGIDDSEIEALPDWLNAIEEGGSASVELDDLSLVENEGESADWLAALVADEPLTDEEDGDKLPEWLTGIVGADTGELVDVLDDGDDQRDLFADEDTESADEVPDWLKVTADSDVEMRFAEAADEPVLDSLIEPELEGADELLAAFDMAGDEEMAFDDPMAWLDQLAAEQEESVEDLPSILDTSMYDTLDVTELAEMAVADEQELEMAEEMPLPVDSLTTLDPSSLDLLEMEEAGDADLVTDLFAADEFEEVSALSWLDALDEEEDDFADLLTLVEPSADDLLDIAEEMEEPTVAEADLLLVEIGVTDEPALSWLDSLDESDALLMDEMETAVADSEDSLETVEVPDDLEEAMAWLDNLEAEDEEELLDDMQTLADLVLLEEETELEDAAQIEVEIDETEIDWLTALTEEDEREQEAEEMAADEGEMEIDWLSALAEEQTDEIVAELPVNLEAEPEPPDPLQKTLNRLEELALQESVPFAFVEPESEEPVEAESLDDVLDWLETQLAAPTAVAPIEEVIETSPELVELVVEEAAMEPMVDEGGELLEAAEDDYALPQDMGLISDDMSDDDILTFMDSILDSDDSFIPEKDVSFTPDDPHAVPSFYTASVVEEVIEVEETAVTSPTEETFDIALETGAVEDDEFADLLGGLADDMSDDDILAFMDSVLSDEESFVPEKDVSFTPDDPNAVPSFYTVAVVEEEAEEVAEEPFDIFTGEPEDVSEADVLGGMFDDLADDMSDDDILSFMDSIFGDEGSFIPEKDVSFTPDDPNAVPSFAMSGLTAKGIAEPEADMIEVPDDPNEAIGWLQVLADAQDDEADMPPTTDLDEILPEIDEDFTADLFADVPGAAETAADRDTLSFDETLADSLPDWLEFGDEERMPGHTDWLRSLPEPDVAGWLEAEEEVMSSNIFEEIPVPLEPERPSLFTPIYESPASRRSEPEINEDDLVEEEEVSKSAFNLNEDALAKARRALSQGNYDIAMNQYRSMIEEGQGLSALIADLESATEQHMQQPRLRRILGDAYMRNGQLQRALETYRVALDQL